MRRMIDPQTIIKSQIVDDKYEVDLHELLEKYGTESVGGIKSVTLQIYFKENLDDGGNAILSDTGIVGCIMTNTAITISKSKSNEVYIFGLLVDNLNDMNFKTFIEVIDGNYENGIRLSSAYRFDIHVIKV